MASKRKPPVLEALREATVDERQAIEFLEAHRWGAEPTCPRCGVIDVYMMRTTSGERNPDFRWRCRSCKRMFTVRTGTVFEESRLPVRVWAYAFWKASSSKKGISALQLAREMAITQKSALFVLRRIRHGLAVASDAPKFNGTVEADQEIYVRGKPRLRGVSTRGRGTRKTPVLRMVQRVDDAALKILDWIGAKSLAKAIAEKVEAQARLITPELPLYGPVGRACGGGHETVNHSAGECYREDTHVHFNTIKGAFSLLKRGVTGAFHSTSSQHLPNYLDGPLPLEHPQAARWPASPPADSPGGREAARVARLRLMPAVARRGCQPSMKEAPK